ncbi:MAG: response regulator [Nitrospirota bacterium]
MIIDDDPTICSLMSRIINRNSDFPAEVKTFNNGKDAITEINSSFFDLCFLDIQLPDLNGLHVMKKIKELSPETKIVIMTAGSVTDDSRKLIEDNAYMFIGKPFDLLQIKIIARQALKKDDSFRNYNFDGTESIKDRRLFQRTALMKDINYYLEHHNRTDPHMESLECCIIDISSKGMGIRTFHPLKPGHLFIFNIDITEHKAGIIKWSMVVDNNNYRAGIEFI